MQRAASVASLLRARYIAEKHKVTFQRLPETMFRHPSRQLADHKMRSSKPSVSGCRSETSNATINEAGRLSLIAGRQSPRICQGFIKSRISPISAATAGNWHVISPCTSMRKLHHLKAAALHARYIGLDISQNGSQRDSQKELSRQDRDPTFLPASIPLLVLYRGDIDSRLDDRARQLVGAILLNHVTVWLSVMV